MDKMRQWSMLTAVAVVAVLGLGWFFLVSPQRSHAADLRDQAASQQQANATLQSQVNQLEQQKKGLPAQQRELDQIAEKIPSDPQLPSLIRELSAAAKGAGVDLVSLAPGKPTLATSAASAPTTPPTAKPTTGHAAAPSPLAQIPVTLQVTGSYFNIESFFAAVEKLDRAMLVTGFSLSPGGGSSSGSSTGKSSTDAPGTLTGSINATVFESPDTTAPTTQPTPVASSSTGSK